MKQKVLYESDSGPLYRSDIVNALKESGLEKGDSVMIHTRLSSFGRPSRELSKEELMEEILNAFLEVIGSEGTLFVPAFTYSFTRGEVFDVANSPSIFGSFTEYVRQRKESIRSEDPIVSVCGIGKMAKPLLTDTGEECFGKDSFFARFHKSGGKLLTFGMLFDITFMHYIERQFGIGWRYNKTFTGKVIHPDGRESTRNAVFFVRRTKEEGMDVQYDYTSNGHQMTKLNRMQRVELGSGVIFCSDVAEVYDWITMTLGRNEYAFLKFNPVTGEKVTLDP